MAYNKREHLAQNIDIIRQAFALEKSGRQASPEQQQLFRQYSGFGGLKCVLYDANTPDDIKKWPQGEQPLFPLVQELHAAIREGVKGDEQRYKAMVDSLRTSVLTAFYTPEPVVSAIAQSLANTGLNVQTILEPSAGAGQYVENFQQAFPDAVTAALEKDALTGLVLKHAHPNATVAVRGLESIPNSELGKYDAVVSNIPFGNFHVPDSTFHNSSDPVRRQAGKAIHNYFFLKGMDTLRDGGVMAFITSQGVADAPQSKPIREWLMQHANLVSALRLPNNVFSENAGTDVGSDLIVLQKNAQKKELSEAEKAFVEHTQTKAGQAINRYIYRRENLIFTAAENKADRFGKPIAMLTHSGGVNAIAQEISQKLQRDFEKNLQPTLFDDAKDKVLNWLGMVPPKGTVQANSTPQNDTLQYQQPDMVRRASSTSPELLRQPAETDDNAGIFVGKGTEDSSELQRFEEFLARDKKSREEYLSLYDEQLVSATSDIVLPSLPENVLAAIGCEAKPILIKKNVLEKNSKSHPDLTPEDSRQILNTALYNPDLVGQTQPKSREHYWVTIKLVDRNAIVVIDLFPTKENIEVVGWHYINEKGIEKLKRQAEREGGQILILAPSKEGLAAALSALPSDSSFADKGTQNIPETQEKTIEKTKSIIEAAQARTIQRRSLKRRTPPNDGQLNLFDQQATPQPAPPQQPSPTKKEKTEVRFTPALVAPQRLQAQAREATMPLPPHIHGGSLYYDAEANELLRMSEMLDGKKILNPLESTLSADETAMLTQYVQLRDTYHLLYNSERESKQAAPDLRAQLNKRYDDFVARFNSLNSPANRAIIGKYDDGNQNIFALELKNADKNFIKSDIFSKPVSFAQERATTTIDDALFASLNQFNEVRLDFIAVQANTSPDEAAEQLTGKIFYNPLVPTNYEIASKMLSGNVVEKLEILQGIQTNTPDERLAQTINALRGVVPEQIPFELLDFNLGERWIPAQVYSDFATHLFGVNTTVRYVQGSDDFSINTPHAYAPEIRTQWAVKTSNRLYDGLSLLHYALLNTSPNITMMVDWRNPQTGKVEKVRRTDKESTQAVNAKVDAIREAFSSWLKNQTSEYKNRIADLYNRKFNCYVKAQYDGTHQDFPGLTFANFDYDKLYDTQKNAIFMLKQNGGGIIDHEVGGGKSMIMVAGAQEMKRLGLANRPMIVAMKANIEQIVDTYKKAYPNAKILYPAKEELTTKQGRTKSEVDKNGKKVKVETEILEGDNLAAFLRKIKNNDWDCIVLTKEQFKLIPQSLRIQKQILDEELTSLQDCVDTFEQAQGKGSDTWEKKNMQRQIENLTSKVKAIQDKINGKRKDVPDFEELGIDHLFVDESHNFKNLRFVTKHNRVAGLGNSTGSEQALNMLYAIRTIQNRTGKDLGATFLSGTTISNSLTEMYLLFKYLRPRELAKQNIYSFDAWAAIYAKKSKSYELSVVNEIIQKERFKDFIKVPELLAFYCEITDFKTAADIGLDRPKKNEILVSLPQTGEQKEFSERLKKFAKDGDATLIDRAPLSASEDKARMLIATNTGCSMSLDMRLINSEKYHDSEGSKLSHAAKKIAEYYQKFDAQKGTQFVFSDLGTPDSSGMFNVYRELKSKLVAQGIPPGEIRFVHEAKTDAQRKQMFDDMNAGKIRVLVGSTQKLGTGVNAQERAVAVHHLDTPWRPSDLEQRNGRAVRKGNWVAKQYNNNQVDVLTYATELTMDAFKYNLLTAKAHFIAQAKANKAGVRSYDEGDMSEAAGFSYATFAAILSGDTTLLDLTKAKGNLNRLESERHSFYANRADKLRQITQINDEVDELNKTLLRYKADYALFEAKKKELGVAPIPELSDFSESSAKATQTQQNQKTFPRELQQQANAQWNKALEQFKAGTSKSALSLGKPQSILQAAGVKGEDITIAYHTLKEKLQQHNLTVDDLKNLAEAIQKPIMVYNWGTKSPATVIITELTTADERKITVAIRAENKSGNLEVNEVASVHGKVAERFLSEMANAKEGGLQAALRFINKEKSLEWLLPLNGIVPSEGDINALERLGLTMPIPIQELNSIAKVIQNFDNPKILTESSAEAVGTRLNEMADTLNTRGEFRQIGTLYGGAFQLMMKTELGKEFALNSEKVLDLAQNKFYVQNPESGIKYSFNRGTLAKDPETAAANFYNALGKLPELIAKLETKIDALRKPLPVLQKIVAQEWDSGKEQQLAAYKTEIKTLEAKLEATAAKNAAQGAAPKNASHIESDTRSVEHIDSDMEMLRKYQRAREQGEAQRAAERLAQAKPQTAPHSTISIKNALRGVPTKKEDYNAPVVPENIVRAYENFKQKHPDKLLLYRTKDEYLVIGKDAQTVNKILHLPYPLLANSQLRIPAHELDDILPRLTRAGFRVAVGEPMPEAQQKAQDFLNNTEEGRRLLAQGNTAQLQRFVATSIYEDTSADSKKAKVININPAEIVDSDGKPIDLKNNAALRNWLLQKYQGKIVDVKDDGKTVLFARHGIEDSLKRRGENQRQIYADLESLIEYGVYGGFELGDSKHPTVERQNIYYSAAKIGDSFFGIRFKIDIFPRVEKGSYKDHKIAEITIEKSPSLYRNFEVSQPDGDLLISIPEIKNAFSGKGTQNISELQNDGRILKTANEAAQQKVEVKKVVPGQKTAPKYRHGLH